MVAHPDDETIFFGGLVQVYRRRPWKIICVTDANADGQGDRRRADFQAACDQLKVKNYEMWDFPDHFEKRLNVEKIAKRLELEGPSEVFTHGILGEYGHPHHQDVSLATYRTFNARAKVWSPAYNCASDKVFRIPRKIFERKCALLSKTYFAETNRFARFLPAADHEGFTKLKLKEVEALYAYLAKNERLKVKELHQYAWFEPYLEEFRRQSSVRPF